MGYKKGVDRYQVNMFPPTYEELVPQDDEVRLIDEFAKNITDIRFQYSEKAKTGNNPYNPLDMVKIFIYGYLNKIRSSRQLEKACKTHIPLIWLVNGLKPTAHTISNFRKNNAKQIKKVLKNFNLICRNVDLFSKELVAIDGTKIEAYTSKDKIYTKEQLKTLVDSVDKNVKTYLEEVKINDRKEAKIPYSKVEDVKRAIANNKETIENVENLLKELEEKNEKQVSLVDEDARIMSQRNKKTIAGYNVQVAAESKNNMIVEFEVTNHGNDENELSNMAIKAKEALAVDKLDVVADMGYENRKEFEKCVDNGITPYTNIKRKANSKEYFSKDKFEYIKDKDIFICPAQREMVRASNHWDSRTGTAQIEYFEKNNCRNCKLKSQCCKGNRRKVSRWEKEYIVDNMKTDRGKEVLRRRKGIVEPVHGIIKRAFGYTYFLVKGLKNVTTEFSLMALAYNMRRAINILGVPKLIEIIKMSNLTQKIA